VTGTILVTGGTDGIGRAVALDRLLQGHRVLVAGRNAERGAALVDAGATFLPVDLDSVEETERLIDEVTAATDRLDAVVLCARHYRSRRTLTSDGFESTFAHFYLSRFLLSYGLAPLTGLVVNVAGPGADPSVVHWDDLQLRHGYHGTTALGQGGKLNDLLGVSFAQQHGDRVRTVLVHPGQTSTGLAGDYDAEVAPHIARMRQHAKPVADAARPILALLDDPPDEPLSAWVEGVPLPTDGPGFGLTSARRLHALTTKLLAAR
jgi:NAD(P)-dependent dehydrogenase (short-subunit alcohol dehydrogenase family)